MKQAYQELVFPKGFVYDTRSKKFLTPEISPLYRLDLGEMGVKNDKNYVMVILADQTWNTLLENIQKIDTAIEEQLLWEEQ